MIVYQEFMGERLPLAHGYPQPRLRWPIKPAQVAELCGPADKPLSVVEFKRVCRVDACGLSALVWEIDTVEGPGTQRILEGQDE
jgi:hypothetical protein